MNKLEIATGHELEPDFEGLDWLVTKEAARYLPSGICKTPQTQAEVVLSKNRTRPSA